jgi:hypothetical protein
MNQRSYLDYNATAPLRDEVRTDVIDALSLDGNRLRARRAACRAAVEAAGQGCRGWSGAGRGA